VKVCFTSKRKEGRASEVMKAVERDSAWSWYLVGNSSYLNGDIRITGGDSELSKEILVSIIWFAFLCFCYPNCLSD
jgi:hypothetical protein